MVSECICHYSYLQEDDTLGYPCLNYVHVETYIFLISILSVFDE